MATSIFDQQTIITAARLKVDETIKMIQRGEACIAERQDQMVLQQMKPKWYRPWKQSREKAESALQAGLFPKFFVSYPFQGNYIQALRKATRIAELAERTKMPVTLTCEEVAFLFPPINPVNN